MARKIAIVSLFLAFLVPAVGFAAGFERDLHLGMRGEPDVTRLQDFLRAQGVYGGPVTGNFFALTLEGVKKFQKREGIEPQAGYFGPKTRNRANAILSLGPLSPVNELPKASQEDQIKFLVSKIEELRARLKALQEQPIGQAPVEVVTPPADKTPPAFTKMPVVSEAKFITGSSFGIRYPYRVVLDWTTDEVPAEESVSCTPAIKNSGGTGSKSAQYFPAPNTLYLCVVTIKDSAGNSAEKEVSFSSPSWINAETLLTVGFPAIDVTPTKFGEFKVYNGTQNEVLYANFETLIIDEMESPRNRNREVTFIIRDGKLSTDEKIGEKKFTFVLSPPKTGDPYKAPFILPFPVKLEAGEERTYSLWVEQFKYVISGTLEIKTTKIDTVTPVDNNRGGFDFILTREHAL